MMTRGRVRSFVCLLLAVSTAIAAAAPARACACPSVVPSPAESPAAAPTAKSCCPAGAKKHACCSPSSPCGAAKTSCGSPTTGRTETPAPAGCCGVQCDCDTPGVPPAPAAPTPAAPDADAHATPSVVPPLFVAGPPATARDGSRSEADRPPTDLVISLSRLTC